MSRCSTKLDKLFSQWNDTERRSLSYDDIDEIKASGELDDAFAKYGVIEELYQATQYFLEVLFNKYEYIGDNYKGIKKIVLETSDLNRVFKSPGAYMTCAFMDNTEAYRDFPAYVLSLAKKFNFEEYQDVSYEEMLNLIADNMDIEVTAYNLRYKRHLKDTYIKHVDYYGRYSEYKDRVNKRIANLRNEKDFSVFAEEDTYTKELLKIKKARIPEGYVKWVAKEFGDGYGYDILSLDPITKKEMMVEVKSGKSPYCILSKNEFKTAIRTLKQPNTDYYVYKYYMEPSGRYSIKQYIFDKEKLYFRNIKDKNDIYRYAPDWYHDPETGKEIIEFILMPEEQYTDIKQKNK